MNFDRHGDVFVVRYDSPEALSPDRQTPLETALRASSAKAPVGVVFVVGPSVQMVDRSVPDYWLGVTTGGDVKIAAMAIVTSNPAVSVATRGFSTANILRDTSVAVKPFADERSAVEWVTTALARSGK